MNEQTPAAVGAPVEPTVMRHLPGPWTPLILDRPLSEVPAYVAKCIESSPGAEFYFVGAESIDGPVDVCHVGNGPRRNENARLIAAAPELLECLLAVEVLFAPHCKDSTQADWLDRTQSLLRRLGAA